MVAKGTACFTSSRVLATTKPGEAELSECISSFLQMVSTGSTQSEASSLVLCRLAN